MRSRGWSLCAVLLITILGAGVAIYKPVVPASGNLARLPQPIAAASSAAAAVPAGAFLLLETGDYLFLENSKMVLSENGNTAQPITDGPSDGDYDDGGGFDNSAVDIDVGNDAGTAKKGFFYFTETGIPQGSTIVTAYLRVTSSDNLADVTVNLLLVGSDEDAAAVPANKPDAASRPRTTAETYWNNVAAWTADTQYDSPSIKAIIQEIVDRPAFAGPVLIFVEDNGSTVASRRKVHSYNGDPTKVAELIVTYMAPPYVPAPTNFMVEDMSSTTVDLSWVDGSGGEASFDIERSLDGVIFSSLASVTAGTTEYQDTTIPMGHWNFYYRIRSVADGQTSDWASQHCRLPEVVLGQYLTGEGGAYVPCFLFPSDDGYITSYTHRDVFNARNTPSIIYFVTSLLDWPGYMSLAQLQALYDAGWDIANHSQNHPDFTTLTQAQIETELTAAQADLEGWGFTRASLHVCYPYGTWDADTLAAMAAVGAWTGHEYTVGDSFDVETADIYLLPTYILQASTSVATAKGWVDDTIAAEETGMFTFHNLVTGVPAALEYNVSDLAEVLDYVIAQGGLIITIDNLYDSLSGPVTVRVPIPQE